MGFAAACAVIGPAEWNFWWMKSGRDLGWDGDLLFAMKTPAVMKTRIVKICSPQVVPLCLMSI
jgi:hypothetical protein